jgi:hypothetical protein
VPFASKGWAFENGVYVNARHGLRVEVPAGWTVGNEQRYSDRILWVMSRLDAAGRERLGANISHIGVGQTSPEEFARNELEALKQVTYESGGERKALFSVTASGKIRDDLFNLEYVRNDNRSKGANLHFTRNGFGYVISLKWAGDATQEELAELGAVARSMGYPELSFTQAAPAVTATSSRAAGPSTATIGDIVFATDLENRRPVGVATSFPQGTRRIYAFFPWKDLRPDDTVEGTWFKEGKQVLKRSTTVAEVIGRNLAPTGNLWFWVSWGNGAPAGSYHFEVWVNGQLARRGTFDVKPQ